MTMKHAVLFEKAETNWAAYVPNLPGCIALGQTLEETELNIQARTFHAPLYGFVSRLAPRADVISESISSMES